MLTEAADCERDDSVEDHFSDDSSGSQSEGPIAELWDSENESSEDDGQHFGDEDTGSERDASGLLQGSGDEVSESTQVSKSVLVLDSRPIQTHRASGQGFDACSGVCLHPAGNVFVADTGNHRIVVVEGTEAPLNCVCAPVPRTDRPRPRMLSLGDFIHPFAGSDGFDGYENGQPDGVALFSSPAGLCCDREGNIIVADTENHAIRKIVLHEGEGDGMVTTLAGGVNEGFADGPAPTAQFNGPTGVECDQHGNIFVVDTGNHAIRKIAANGIVSTFAGSGMP